MRPLRTQQAKASRTESPRSTPSRTHACSSRRSTAQLSVQSENRTKRSARGGASTLAGLGSRPIPSRICTLQLYSEHMTALLVPA